MAFECFSSIFQGKFNFQGLFKTVLYVQVLFKPVQALASVLNFVFKQCLFLMHWAMLKTFSQIPLVPNSKIAQTALPTAKFKILYHN